MFGASDIIDGLDVSWDERQLAKVRAIIDGVELNQIDDRFQVLGADAPGPDSFFATAISVYRDLLGLETRRDRFSRLLRIWQGKVGAAVREGDFAAADAWLRAVLDDPTYPTDLEPLVAYGFDELSASGTMDELVVKMSELDNLVVAEPLVRTWGKRLVRYLVDQMLVDDPPVNRRFLIEFLGLAGRIDTTLLGTYLSDGRWFVVRNVAIALGRTGREEAASLLLGLRDHADARVRVEALRALVILQRDGAIPAVIDAFSDGDSKVRHAAITLLRASGSPAVLPGLVDLAQSGSFGPEETARLIRAIGERKEPGVSEILGEMAGKRFAVGSAKVARDAARVELERLRRGSR